MKKLLRGVCLIGVVALLATSCKKQPTNAMVYRGYSYDGQFETELANYDEPGRAYIDATAKVMFEQGDKAMLFNIENESGDGSEYAMYEVAATSYQPELVPAGQETVSDELFALGKYAFYPGDNVGTTQMSNGNRATFPIDATQEYREVAGAPVIAHNALYMAAKIDNELEAVNVFAFRNICGVLSLKFFSPSGKTVKSIAVTDHERYLSGDVTLKIHEVDPGYMMQLFRNYGVPGNEELIAEYMEQVGYSVDVDSQTMTIDCGNGVQLGTTRNDAKQFYMVLRPLALNGGFDIDITFSDNSTKSIVVNKDNTIKPNTFRVFPAMNVD